MIQKIFLIICLHCSRVSQQSVSTEQERLIAVWVSYYTRKLTGRTHLQRFSRNKAFFVCETILGPFYFSEYFWPKTFFDPQWNLTCMPSVCCVRESHYFIECVQNTSSRQSVLYLFPNIIVSLFVLVSYFLPFVIVVLSDSEPDHHVEMSIKG